MKILIVMDPGIKIPVTGYGGHERLVEMFAKEYLKLGHEVHLLITEGSHVKGCTVFSSGKEGFPPKKADARKAIVTVISFLWKRRKEYDLIHNFGRLLYLLPVLNYPVKKIMTYGREITGSNITKLLKLPHKNIVFTGCSKDLISRSGAAGEWHAVYNAVEFDKYELKASVADDAPFAFLGRVEEVKGCHTAIEIAKVTGNNLVIAGNISPLENEKKYFHDMIEPHIDGVQIKYIGAVNDEQKNELLGRSKALLFPIEWNEPFGIVMVEAMSCGTPVIGFKRGSVNEVVDENITGFKVSSKEEMIDAAKKISTIDRAACRAKAEERFDVSVIAKHYLQLAAEMK